MDPGSRCKTAVYKWANYDNQNGTAKLAFLLRFTYKNSKNTIQEQA